MFFSVNTALERNTNLSDSNRNSIGNYLYV